MRTLMALGIDMGILYWHRILQLDIDIDLGGWVWILDMDIGY
jgi:hypothetical protein